MLEDELAYVIGVDTHRDEHTLAIVEARTQRVREPLAIAANRVGYRRALRLARRRAPGCRVWAIEGSGSYGAGFTRFLASHGEQVREIERPKRAAGRRGKSDLLDAERAPRSDRETQALRALLVTRESAVKACTQSLNELRALLVTAPAELRERLHGLSEKKLLGVCGNLRRSHDSERSAYALALRSEAAFARLAGAAPIPASSGATVRYRLDRGGERRLNRALHTILLTRRRQDPATRAYIARRLAEGKSEREAVRCLKRCLARSLFRLLENAPMVP